MISFTWRRYLQLLIAAFGLLSLLFLLVAAAYVHNMRFDLSPGNRFTLSDHAHKVLDAVKEPIKITAFIRTEDPRNPLIKDLLWQVAGESPYISYDVVDINRHPALANQYGVNAYGATVVESATKRADFGQPSESLLMSAILEVVQDPKKVYVLTGHGECSIKNTDRRNGCSQMRDVLSLESYDIEELSLAGGADVPQDADVVILNGPRGDLLEVEARSIERYLASGGDLLVLIDPFRAPRLVSLLGAYGIEVGANVVIDPDNRLAGGEPFSAVITDLNPRHLISSTLDSPPLFSLTAALSTRRDEESGRVVVKFLKTGPRSWASFDHSVVQGSSASFVAGRDVNGPLAVWVEVSQRVAEDVPGRKDARTRIIVYGDSDFANNRFLDYLGNRDLLVNTVNWLAREDHLLAARPQRKEGGKNQFFISQSEGESVFWTAVIVQPGFFLLIALALLLWRRLTP